MEIPFEKKTISIYIKKLGAMKHGSEVVKADCLGGGSYGLVWALEYADNKTEIIKAFKIASMLQMEAESLRLLKQASPLPVPEVFYTHEATEELPINALCMERIEGVNGLACKHFMSYSKTKRQRFAKIVTDTLFEIQQTTDEKFGYVEKEERYDTWLEFYGKIARETYEKAKSFYADGKLPPIIFSLLEKGVQKIDYILAESSEKPSLTHGDFYVMNIMVDKKTLTPTGIIDPFEAMWGDKEYDLWHLDAWTGKNYRLYETYKSKYPTTERVELKCVFYSLVNEVYHHMKSGWSSKRIYLELAKRATKQYKKYGLL